MQESVYMNVINIDGTGAVLGRLATRVVKELMKGESVNIVNAGKIVITGNPKATLSKYTERRQRGSPHHGPFFPKTPDGIVKRAIRGMIPYKTTKGRAALKNLRVYVYESENVKETISMSTHLRSKYITIEELSKTLGWKK
jgi:large subunit ribosomal protein L13